MPDPKSIAPLLAALADLARWLHSSNCQGVVIGGVAASLLGRPRVTRDIDALVLLDEHEWKTFLEKGKQAGFQPRIEDAIAFAERSRVLLARHVASSIDVDITFGALLFEEQAIARRIVAKVGDIEVPLPTPEDLVVMKAVAHRPRDLGDIEGIVAANPGLDVERIRQWVREFAKALGLDEIERDLEQRLGRKR